MLINTVILFIKDILPVFILLCFINTLVMPNFLNRQSSFAILLGTLIGVYCFYTNIEHISEMFDGDGIEIFNSVVNFAMYISLLFVSINLIKGTKPSNTKYLGLLIAATIYTATNLSEFFLFFLTLWSNQTVVSNILVGVLFGLGICVSFSVLLALSLQGIKAKSAALTYSLVALYLAGLATKSLQYLQQIDVINVGNFIWDTSQYISDSSEYGYICNALFGYIASPTIEYLVTYFMSLLICTILYFVFSHQSNVREELNVVGGAK